MRESCTYGSVRGALSNERSYRDSDTRPRDLTAAELDSMQAPPRTATQSAPLAVPPGTQVAVADLDPRPPFTTAAAAPTAAPPNSPGSGGSGAPLGHSPPAIGP